MENREALFKGIKSGMPIGLGFIPISITFGLIAKSQGLPLWFTAALSLIVFAGSSQFIALQLLAAGAGIVEVLLTTFAINFRNFLMASSVTLRGPAEYPAIQKVLTGLTVTDESFAVVSGQPESKLPFAFVMGLQGTLYVAWNAGTLLGATLVGELGAVWNNSLGIAIYAMFICLLIPVIRTDSLLVKVAALTGILSAGLNLAGAQKVLGNSTVLLISGVIGAAFGAWLLNREERSHG